VVLELLVKEITAVQETITEVFTQAVAVVERVLQVAQETPIRPAVLVEQAQHLVIQGRLLHAQAVAEAA
jgi:hypothetical protein